MGSLIGLEQLALASLAGLCVGFLSGVFGFGGGFLLVPVLNVILRIDMNVAVGSCACQVLGPATTSLLARKIGAKQLQLPLTVSGGLLVGVFCGAGALEWTKGYGEIQLPARSVPLAEPVVLSIYLLLLVCVGVLALWEARRVRKNRDVKRGWLEAWKLPPYGEFSETKNPRLSIVAVSWFGLGVGFLSGLLGMSGGMVLLPGLIYLFGVRTQRSVVTSLVIVWIVAVQATIIHAWHENIDITLVLVLLAGGTVGARLGSELGVKLEGHRLRQCFGWLLIATALLVGGRLFRLMLP